MTTLMQATNQWSNRPADERFKSLADLHEAVSHHRSVAVEAPNVALGSLRITTGQNGDGVVQPRLVGPTGQEASFTHHSFGQMCRRIGAPASYLRALPAGLVSANMNNGQQMIERDDHITFGTLSEDGVLSNVRLLKQSDIGKCPHLIFVPEHYRDDGSCKCNDPEEQARMIREWGYSAEHFR